MAAKDPTPATGAITTKQAVGLISGRDAPTLTIETDDDAAAPGDATTDDDDGTEADAQPLAAPPFWTAEHKAVFDTLPREAQAIILDNERSRVAAAGKVFQDAARMRDQAHGALQHAQRLGAAAQAAITAAPGLDQEAVPGVTDPNGRPMSWAQVDWDHTERTDPRLAGALRAIHYTHAHKRQAQLSALTGAAHQAQAHADHHAFNAYVASENGKLNQLHPKLASDTGKRQAIGRYLLSQGIDRAALRGIGAQEMILAEKAMNWDRLNAAAPAQTPGQTPPARAPSRPGLRPSAAPAAVPQKRAAQEAVSRFAQSRSRNDAVDLLNART